MKIAGSPIAAVAAMVAMASAPAPAATVYVPLGSAGEVLIIDTETDSIRGGIGSLPDAHGLGGVPGTAYLVVGSYAESPPAGPAAIAKPAGVSDDEHAAHHAPAAPSTRRPPRAVSVLTVLDAKDLSVVRRIEVPGAVHHVALSPDGRYAVATHPNDDGVSVVDLSTFSVLPTVMTGAAPNYAVFSPRGERLYVSNAGNGTVSEIDTRRWIVRRNLLAGDSPEHLAISRDGRTLYVVNLDPGQVAEIALGQGEVVRTFAVGGEAHGLGLSADGRTLFAVGKGDEKLVAVNLETGQTRSAPLGPAPYHLAVIGESGKLYVSSREQPTIWVVDGNSLAPTAVIPIRGEGHQMVVVP